MKHLNIFLTFVFLLGIGIGCAPSNLEYNEAIDRNNRKLETDAQRDDAKFLVEAANYNLLLEQLSQKATEMGYARIVVDFANTALADHMRMRTELKELAKNKKIALPTTMSERLQQHLSELTTTDKEDFDKFYLNTTENLHERAISMFENAALNANDSNIRAFAAAKLDMMRMHERKADDLENQLL